MPGDAFSTAEQKDSTEDIAGQGKRHVLALSGLC